MDIACFRIDQEAWKPSGAPRKPTTKPTPTSQWHSTSQYTLNTMQSPLYSVHHPSSDLSPHQSKEDFDRNFLLYVTTRFDMHNHEHVFKFPIPESFQEDGQLSVLKVLVNTALMKNTINENQADYAGLLVTVDTEKKMINITLKKDMPSPWTMDRVSDVVQRIPKLWKHIFSEDEPIPWYAVRDDAICVQCLTGMPAEPRTGFVSYDSARNTLCCLDEKTEQHGPLFGPCPWCDLNYTRSGLFVADCSFLNQIEIEVTSPNAMGYLSNDCIFAPLNTTGVIIHMEEVSGKVNTVKLMIKSSFHVCVSAQKLVDALNQLWSVLMKNKFITLSPPTGGICVSRYIDNHGGRACIAAGFVGNAFKRAKCSKCGFGTTANGRQQVSDRVATQAHCSNRAFERITRDCRVPVPKTFYDDTPVVTGPFRRGKRAGAESDRLFHPYNKK